MTHLRQWKRLGRFMVECTLSITHCLRLNLQLHTIELVRTCRISSFCTVAWQLARFQLTRRIARSLGDSWASCSIVLHLCSHLCRMNIEHHWRRYHCRRYYHRTEPDITSRDIWVLQLDYGRLSVLSVNIWWCCMHTVSVKKRTVKCAYEC